MMFLVCNRKNCFFEIFPIGGNRSVIGVADRLDPLVVMLGMEAMLSALDPSEDPVRNGSEWHTAKSA